MNTKTQIVCAWSGFVGTWMFFAGLIIAGFLPPPSPSLSVEEVVSIYQQNATGIRIGMLLIMVSGMFIAPLIATLTVQMKRIEGPSSVLAYTQLAAGSFSIAFFCLPGIIFLVTAFRPDRAPEITYMLNDFSWIIAIIPWPMQFMMNVAMGWAILSDKRPQPVFPRWLAYFNFWFALSFIPASILAFVKTGPFAWNGIFPFWIPAFTFGLWYIIVPIMLTKAAKQQEREEAVA